MTEAVLVQARAEADAALAAGDHVAAQFWLRRAWRASPTGSVANWIARVCGDCPGYFLKHRRVAFERSLSIEPLVPLVRALAALERISLQADVGPFNAYAQQILAPSSPLHEDPPDLVFLTVLTRSIAPELWSAGYLDVDPEVVARRVLDELAALVRTFRDRNPASLVLSLLELPVATGGRAADLAQGQPRVEAVRAINRGLLDLTASMPGVHLHDLEHTVRLFGADRAYDDRRWESIRWPFTADLTPRIAADLGHLVALLAGVSSKVLVVDLDNTLWNGVLGEEGVDGIAMGPAGAGAPHRALQEALLELWHRGVLLAVSSKNDHAAAWSVIESHPDMLLRPRHFAAVRIDWTDKATNLRSIADELNVGIDALAFLDDNPAEQHAVRIGAPQVRVLDVTCADELAAVVRRDPAFDRLVLSDDDRRRGEMYAQQRLRREVHTDQVDLADWLQSLETEMERVSNTAATLVRVAQLTQKTNQFNLTTHRYTEQEIANLDARPDRDVAAFRVADRFGDNGTVAVAIVEHGEGICAIDTLLLSCRVIGRGVETAVLAWIAQRALSLGARTLRGRFDATDRNAPCATFLPDHGFVERPDGTWELALDPSSPPSVPAWIEMASNPPEASHPEIRDEHERRTSH